MLASLYGLSLASSVLPVLTTVKPEEMREDAGVTLWNGTDKLRLWSCNNQNYIEGSGIYPFAGAGSI